MSINHFIRGVGVGIAIAAVTLFVSMPSKDINIEVPYGFTGQVYRAYIPLPEFGHAPNFSLQNSSGNEKVLGTKVKEIKMPNGEKAMEVMVLFGKDKKLNLI